MMMLDHPLEGESPPRVPIYIPDDDSPTLASWEPTSGPKVLFNPNRRADIILNHSYDSMPSYVYKPLSPLQGSWISTDPPVTSGAKRRHQSPTPSKSNVRSSTPSHAPQQESRRSFTPNITRRAHEMKREGTVADQMYKKAEEYKAHIHAMRKQKEDAELSTLRATPEINRTKPEYSRVPVEQRLAEKMKTYQTNTDSERQKKQMQEMSGVTLSPSLNRKTRELTENRETHTAMQYWELKKREKLQALQRNKEMKEISEIKSSPSINEKSKKIADRQIERRVVDVAERLMRQGEDTKRRLMEKRCQELEMQQQLACPTLHTVLLHGTTKDHSKGVLDMGSDDDEIPNSSIHERLYAESREIAVRKMEQVLRSQETEFTPKINKKSQNLSGGDIPGNSEPVYERLMRYGEDQRQRRAEELRRIGNEAASQADVSKYLGAYTNLLGDLNRTSGSSRNSSPGPFHTSLRAIQHQLHSGEADCTHKPRIGENSRRIDESVNGTRSPRDTVNRLIEAGRSRDEKLKRSKAEMEKKEKEQLQAMKTVVRSRTPTRDMYEWNMEWQSKVRNTMNRTREKINEEKESEFKEHCSFAPKINKKKDGTYTSGSVHIIGDDDYA